MHIQIIYNDGSIEQVPVRLEGSVVSQGGRWLPGHIVDQPCRCYFGADYFGCALDEGGERAGTVEPEAADLDPEDGTPEWQGFQWEFIGSEENACRRMLRKWIGILGQEFDPLKRGTEYLHEDILRTLSDEEARVYESNMQCWCFYLDDPVAEAALIQDEYSSGNPGPYRP